MPGEDKSVMYADFFIIGIDNNGKLIAFNKKCEELTGFRRDEILHRRIWNVVFPKELKKNWENIFSNGLSRLELPILDKTGKKYNVVWSPMQVGTKSRELWLIGVEKREEKKLWDFLEIDVVSENPYKKTERGIPKSEVDALREMATTFGEASEIIKKQWKKLEDYADRLDRLKSILENEQRLIHIEKKKIEDYKKRIDRLIEEKIHYFRREFEKNRSSIEDIKKVESMIRVLDSKMKEIEEMRENLDVMMEAISKRDRELEDLKKTLEIKKESLKTHVREIDRKNKELKIREKNLDKKEEIIRRRSRELDDRYSEILNFKIRLEKEKKHLEEKVKNLEKRLKMEESRIREEMKEKYRNLMEKRIQDMTRRIDILKKNEKDLKEEVKSLKDRERELKNEIKILNSRDEKIKNIDQKIREKMDKLREIEQEIDVKSKLLENIESTEKRLLDKEKELEMKEKLLLERERELSKREKEIKKILLESTVKANINKSEREERESEEKLIEEKILGIEKPAIVLKKGSIYKITPSFAELTGYEESDLIKRSFFSLIDPHELPNLQRYYLLRLKGEASNSYNTVILSSNMERIPVKIKLNQIKLKDDIFDLAIVERSH